MTQLWVLSLILCGVGLWLKQTSMLIIGLGLFSISWATMMDDVLGSPIATLITLRINKWVIQWRVRKLLFEHEKLLLLCRRFAQKYPRYLRISYRLGEFNEISVDPLLSGQLLPINRELIPTPWHDLAALVQRHVGQTIDVLLLVLVANREVCRLYRDRIEKEVIQNKELETAEDFSSACLRFSIWERECEKESGVMTLLYRELFASLLEESWSLHRMRQFVKVRRYSSLLAVVNKGISDAKESVAKNRRAILLESHLVKNQGTNTPHTLFQSETESVPLSIDSLRHVAKENLPFCVHLLREIFMDEKTSTAYRMEAEEDGYFMTDAAEGRILFQVGLTVEGDTLETTLLDRVYVRMALEQADRALILALGRLDTQFLQYADELSILVLPSEELDRLLSAYTERMWHIVDWSLRTSMRIHERTDLQGEVKNSEEITSEGLELGLST